MEAVQQRHGVSVPVLTGITALGSMSVSVYLPSLPSIADSLHAGHDAAKLTLTAFLFTFAAAQLVYGPLSDRFGRKLPIVTGLITYIAGGIACSLSPTIGFLIGARVLQAAGASAGPALGRAVLRDLFEGPALTSALSLVAAAVALSPMLGPFIGGIIAVRFGWRAIFFVLALAGTALAAAVMLLLPETIRERDAQSTRFTQVVVRYRRLLTDREYASAVLCGGCLTAGNFAWNATGPFFLQEQFHVRPDRYGTLSILIGGGYVAGTVIAARLAGRFQAPVVVYAGLSCSLTGGVVVLFGAYMTNVLSALIGGAALFSLGMGIVIPAAAACALSRFPGIAGSAASLLGALQIFTGALGTIVAGLFESHDARPTAWIMTVCATLAFCSGYVALLSFRGKPVPEGVHA